MLPVMIPARKPITIRRYGEGWRVTLCDACVVFCVNNEWTLIIIPK